MTCIGRRHDFDVGSNVGGITEWLRGKRKSILLNVEKRRN